MRYKLAILFIYFLATQHLFAQESNPISISYEKTNDTIWLSATNIDKPGSLMVVADLSKKRDTTFFPLIDSTSYFKLILPLDAPSGILQLQAFFCPQIFAIKGKVENKIKDNKINVILITKNDRLFNKTILLNSNNGFVLPRLVFENQASIIFNYIEKKKKSRPDISFEQTPSPQDFKELVFSENIEIEQPLPDSAEAITSIDVPTTVKDSLKNIKSLKNVTIKTIVKSKAEQYNEENSTALFNDANEKLIDCLGDESILSYPDCLSFLRSRIAGLMVNTNKFGEPSMMWRGTETQSFYIDEIPVDIEQLLSIDVNDIAIIKAYPPPFIGGEGNGNGGAIVIYTRKGEYRRPGSTDNKWLFKINGYSPAIHTLQLN